MKKNNKISSFPFPGIKPGQKGKIKSGDELPHQPDDIRPEDWAEPEQEPPDKIIGPKDYAHLPENKRAVPAELSGGSAAPLRAGFPESPDKASLPPSSGWRRRLAWLRRRANRARTEQVKKNEGKIMQFAKKHQKVTNDDVEALVGVGDRQASRYLKRLVQRGELERLGRFRYTFYKPVKKY